MANYRFYVLDKDDHVREPPQVFECPNDATAVEQAISLVNGRVVEVSGSLSRVVRLEPVSGLQQLKQALRGCLQTATCAHTIPMTFVCFRPLFLTRWHLCRNPPVVRLPRPKRRSSAKD